ncbi:MAG: FG-GAP-like repeat-containing protein [Myxococcales bacterium]|nr:FG-GAP-like repeat-containing protein [Myxococcales bacterium]
MALALGGTGACSGDDGGGDDSPSPGNDGPAAPGDDVTGDGDGDTDTVADDPMDPDPGIGDGDGDGDGMEPGDGREPGDGDATPMGGTLTVESVTPVARAIAAPVDSASVVRFDRAVAATSVTAESFWAFGRFSGPVRDGERTISDDGLEVTLTPPKNWVAGDRVTVILSHDLEGEDGTTLRSEGYSFQFGTAAATGSLDFQEIDRQTTKSGSGVRSYGGSAADLDGDGYIDLMIVNEDSLDLRIFMNRGDGSGTFEPYTETPIVPLDQRASPSETTDFNGDGVLDLVTANLDANNLSILFGNGDGTFVESQKIRVGEQPRGVAVIDADGDGDVDIANTNANSDNMSVLLNDGSGLFPEDEGPGLQFFDSGHGMVTASQEFGLFAGDMNEDGLLDLVIGARGLSGQNSGVVVNTGKGDGTFEFLSMHGPMATPWQLAVGDLDGDGHEDVATADGDLFQSQNTVSILLGDGAGGLEVVQAYDQNIDRPFAIDLGDLDGDGDLDTVVSNYRADWEILVNDGSGQMSLSSSVNATRAASCALLVDVDSDGDLDLVLIDEEEDEIIVMQQ